MIEILKQDKQTDRNAKNKEMKKVESKDCDRDILKALNKAGFQIKFGDAGKYVDCENKKGCYKCIANGKFREEGEPIYHFRKYHIQDKDLLIHTFLEALQPYKSKPIIIRCCRFKTTHILNSIGRDGRVKTKELKQPILCIYVRFYNELFEKENDK